jgi:uracil-DNA glycosylase family 4
LIGEGPNKSEDRKGIPFVGPSGKELNYLYLPTTGYQRDEVGCTNATLCSFRGYRNPSLDEARVCAGFHLPGELDSFDPEVIVALGAIACSLFKPAVDLELQHGKPFIGRLCQWIGPVLPLYHPAGGIHDSKLMIQLLRDFPVLKDVLAGWEQHKVAPWKGITKRITTTAELESELAECSSFDLFMDTETDAQGPELEPFSDPPHCLSFCGRQGVGNVIMASDSHLVAKLGVWILTVNPMIYFHNAPFDMPVCRRMDLFLNWSRVHDTMEDAYLTAWMPQGLKTLAYRHLGVKMDDYEDIVRGPSAEHGMRYLHRLSRSTNIPQPYLKPRQWPLHRKARAALDASMDGKADPQDRFLNWPEEDMWAAEDKLGKFPYRSIRFVEPELVIKYSGEDAGVLWDLAPILNRELHSVRRESGA